MDHPTDGQCDRKRLRAHLIAALAEADRCDPMVAIHVDTALAALDQGRDDDQSNDL